MGWTFRDDPIDITSYIATVDSDWHATAAISELPFGTTAIWMRVRQSDTTANTIGARNTGITSTMTGIAHSGRPMYFLLAIQSGAFEYYVSDKTNQAWEIMAYSTNAADECYTTAGAYPPYDPAPAGSYEALTFSQLKEGAAFAVLLCQGSGATNYRTGYRLNATKPDYYYYKMGGLTTTVFCPVASKIGEAVQENAVINHFLTGSLVSGAVAIDRGDDLTITTTDWETIDISSRVPAGAAIAILECRNIHTVTDYECTVRNAGSTFAPTIKLRKGTATAAASSFKIVGLNASRQFEIKVGSTTNIFVNVIGYISNSLTLSLNPWTVLGEPPAPGFWALPRSRFNIEIEFE